MSTLHSPLSQTFACDLEFAPKPLVVDHRPGVRVVVTRLLKKVRSPASIAGRLHHERPGEDAERVSHEAIYQRPTPSRGSGRPATVRNRAWNPFKLCAGLEWVTLGFVGSRSRLASVQPR